MFQNDSNEPDMNEQEQSQEQVQHENTQQEAASQDGASAASSDSESNVKSELQEAQEKYLRLYSDFENFKRRTAKERIELMLSANQEMMLAILPVLDDFERAQKSIQSATDIQAIQEGLTLVQQKLVNILQQKGLKSFDSLGQPFNSDVHEAITEVPGDPSQKGLVMDEVERGYMLGEKVIRYAKVIVGG